ncbi:MAG: hypothetical protein CVV14_01530 [Gammaproteobacteria bacterium HGW-Gammaproteobacteria-4]|jgi:uncharacterized membrane protein YhaH (DUF805 family)|nr:MAG: hypothetical protein CVV14_01530 [Gammaproteobacteria bacterium HGW-Gammaproteobacteria-4]
MHCSNCGINLVGGANFCPSCGHPAPTTSRRPDATLAPQIAKLEAAPETGEERTRLTFFQTILSPDGRIGRITFFKYWLLLLALPILTVYLVAFLIPDATADRVFKSVQLLFIWPNIAILVKRLHDRGHSFLFGLLLLIPLIGVWVIIEAFFLKGIDESNEYGPAP